MVALIISSDGIEKLKVREGAIDGLYDDPSGYATYGVGHLVHPDKGKSLFLDAAQSEKLCDSRIKKKWPGTSYETTYLEREVLACADFEKLKSKSKERAMDTIAQAKFGKAYKDLDDGKKATINSLADAAIDQERQLLNLTVADLFAQDLKPYSKAVNDGVTGFQLTQEEFDALVSFTFNVGITAFQGSDLLKKLNENKFRNGEADDRETAISDIEKSFLAWNKSGGVVSQGLAKRRQDESDQFLKGARAELTALKAASKDKKGVLLFPSPLKPRMSELAIAAMRGQRPDRPV
jgi:lysozyme